MSDAGDEGIADEVAAKMVGAAMAELVARGVPGADWDRVLIAATVRMVQSGQAVRGVEYPRMLFKRLIMAGRHV
jgi:hypothetical protein